MSSVKLEGYLIPKNAKSIMNMEHVVFRTDLGRELTLDSID